MSTAKATVASDPISSLGDALESAAESLGDATTDARESAKVAARKVKRTARSGVYHATYGVSFGVVFAAVFLVELLPEDKLQVIDELSQTGMVGMVGDGINDAPSLARADIGFAMAVIGSDAALETADIALMDDDLRKIPAVIRLSKGTHRILLQNISFALITKALFLVITLLGYGTMWMAVFADIGASLIVVLNALRLLRLRG